ncbi:dynein heavy chain 3, axonemal-like isoform X2 [Octopus vulgaris]|uniref:Dynein heavy chain 3, axonemal-like isoform X2 n=1 Tax=Octopus vulgaris TaxID=6645 RepID=A0AA36AJS4_OCTVU|nr:dynein heavy chain 3, axonemal-like isoform X2 [Octopus vulgaris]
MKDGVISDEKEMEIRNVYQEENVGTTMSFHKTFPRRPTNLIHLPPLNLPKNALSEKPKILDRGSFTQAAPVKEQKEHRRVSDAIANNYSPRASHLTTSLIYETTKYGFTLEEMHMFCPRAQFEKTATVTTDQKYPLSKIIRTPSELSHEGTSLTKSTHISEFHSIPSTIQSTPPRKVESSANSSHSVQKREYSEFEKRILDVQFYSKNYLSEGLPRSGTPIGTDLTRYYNLMAKAIDSDFITPLTIEFLEHTQHFSSNDTLLTAFPKLTNQLLKEIDEDYTEAIKKAILDYILLDPSEQVRLGVYIQPQLLINQADYLVTTLCNKVISDSQLFYRSICKQYDQIVETITRHVTTTSELVALQKYIDGLSCGELLALKEKQEVAAANVMFMMTYVVMKREDFLLINNTFSWSNRITPIISNIENQLQKQHDLAVEKLNGWRKRILDSVSGLSKKLKEFATKDRMSEAQQILAEIRIIENQLEVLKKEKQNINEEEMMLGLEEISEFEQVQFLATAVEPYERLWSNAVKLQTQYECWMNGPLLNVNSEEVDQEVGFDITPQEDTPLSEILKLDLERYLDELSAISSQANKEFALEKALSKMKDDWENMAFNFSPYKDTELFILSAFDDIQALLDDHIVKTTTMKGSAFVGPFEKEIKEWGYNLNRMKDILESWLKVQSAWLYLEPIFGSADIREQIPVQGKMFEEVDQNWKQIMSTAKQSHKALTVASQDQMLEKLQYSVTLLEDIQCGLNDYLEKKRLFFPRFFFLSNDELLEILSETKDPLRVQPHLKKCFESIAQLVFTPEKVIVAMESSEKERVNFCTNIVPSEAHGLVEKWLQQAIEKGSIQQYVEERQHQIEEIVEIVRGNISKMARITLGALIVIDVHARDIESQLIRSQVSNVQDFNWISHLRYYFEDQSVIVRMVTTSVAYAYEYLGNSSRLVITPLTDRCYRTLMCAIRLNLGGAPEGPAGTGKTETSKDLAKAVAKQCVVFNCSDSLDYKAMGKFFKGLAQSGAWACFDEFNRIELEVLSVIAQQLQTIQRAIIEQRNMFVFEGTYISLDPTCTIFITMNPGYAGRAELPDNLKVLFRTVAMMVPDYAMISEILLYSMGFVDAKNLSTKIVATYKLCSEQLSTQQHYDYGMRAVRSVLTAVGNLKLMYPDRSEALLVLKSIKDVNLPKFLSQDITLFEGIISDLFPGLELPQSEYSHLEMAIKRTLDIRNLQPVPWYIEKIIQIYNMILVRHGLMIVGEPIAGKTCAYKVLADALGELSQQNLMDENQVDYQIINPKAITMGQLYGRCDPITNEWTDGVLANSFREHASSTSKNRKWMVFDGPVDAIWIENMNTVLDDNKKYLFNWLLPSSLDYVTKHCTQIVPCQYMHLVLNMLKLYECLLEEIRHIGGPQDEMVNVDDIAGFSVIQEKLAEEKSNMIITHFLFALVWSLSATLTFDSSLKFQEFFHKLCETESINARPKEMKFSRSLLIPKKGSIYDYIYMKKQYGSWRTWESLVDPTIITGKTKMNKVLVNTKETEKQNFFLRLFFNQGKPLLFVGPTGTGKSSVINSFLLKLNKDSYITCNINFSAQTSANQTQDIIVSKLERKDTTMFELINVKILSAMAPTSGGRNPITTRFLRHFNIIHIDAFSEDILKEIFSPMTEWHFRQFPVSLRRFSRIIIHATLDIYKKVVTKFLPTPSKSHYVFNLRDFARVIQGILLFSPQSVSEDPECIHKIIRLWTHETYRLFSDRLVDQADQESFFKILKLSIEAQFKEKFNSVFGHLAPKGKQVTPKDMRCLIFGDFMEPKEGSVRLYDEISDQDELRQVIEKYLADYNLMSKTPMDLVMFHLAVEHITRINRVLKQPNGHCLLIGIGGTGRQSATRLAAFIAEFELIQIEMGKDYSTAEWREDLMKIIRKSGEDSTPLVFFLGDYQIKDPSFLEDINMLLNTGDIPNLYDNEQRLEIIEKMQQLTLQENITIEFTSLNMFNKFIERVRQNLHIVLAFSPIGEAFRNRLRMYPSLINCCTIDWFEQWPDDALQLVANKLLDDVEMHEDLRQQSVEMCKHFHISVRALTTKYYEALNHQNYVTPTSYLELIRTFKTLLSQKRMEILTLKNRYVVGLEKLEFSKFQINIMQKELFALQPQLLETSKETVELIKTIEKERHEVEAAKQLVEQDEAVANKAATEAQSIKNECEEKLKLAMPAFNTAVAALHTLKQNDITIVKAMTNPPQGVKLVMAAVCTMKGIKPDKKTDQNGKIVEDYWAASKKMLSDMKFLDSLRDYDKDNIPPAIINKIREKYISNKEFDPSIIKNVSSACEGLCKWVKAIDVYDSVIKNLEFNIELTKVKLERAEKLINGLGGEHDRWIQAVDSLTNTYDNIIGDVLLSASVVAYLGPFISSYRQECLQEWYKCCKKRGIPLSAQFSLSKTLGNPLKIREWQIAGLPVDSFSVENGIIVDNCGRWPLIIDPQGQANKWIKNMECHNKLQVTKHTDANYGRIIENCLQFGCPCLLENVGEELDPLLEPILLKQTFKQVTLINFVITPNGLEDQLLGIVAAREKPDLEEKKNQLIIESAQNKRQLKEIEDKILDVLSNSQGNILEDETAIQVLSSSKTLSEDIEEKQLTASLTELDIDEVRNGYKPVARHGSILFFTISDLANIDPMYQYSLTWFIHLYHQAITNSEPSQILSERINYLNDYFTRSVHNNVCRSLFEKDKLLFTFLLCIGLAKAQDLIDDLEWRFLLTGGLALENPYSNPASDWLPEKNWSEIVRCSQLSSLQTFREHFTNHMIPAIQKFIQQRMGQAYIEPTTFDLSISYEESSPQTPLIFILSPGVDPMAALFRFAEDKGRSKGLQTVSLGQGQGPIAEQRILEATEQGTWVVLQNCHLAVSWFGQLENICETVFKKLLFGLCFFHALVQERRKFGALGWNIPYQFNESDLNVSIQQLQMLINDYEDPPLEALVYLTGECNYGGRVTDNSDRRLIMSLLKKFYCHDIIVNDDYKFSESGLYYAPPCGSLDCYLEYIRGLPYIPHPEVFGLHENADISKDQQETQQLFEGVLKTLPKQTLGAGKSSQDIIEDLASDILSKMPAAFEVEEIQKKYAVSYHESMNTVLVQELLRFNRLLKVIIWSLEEIQKAIYGLVVMSAKLERIVNSMIVGKVPAVWAEKSYPSLKPLGSYVSDLLARIQFFNHWISEGQPTVFWISGFYFTQSFLMGVMQNYARSHKIPIDHLTLSFKIMKQEHEMPSKPITGAYINGLFLEGAHWCRQTGILAEALPKVLYDLMPIIWIKPVKKEEFHAEENYQCPVYKTSARRGNLSTTGHSTNYVLTIQLPSNRDEDYWINQGVALLCQLDN